MIITFHSYKGGTGKTLLSVNLATLFANVGKKVCLVDLDFSAPSLHSIFKIDKPEYWFNDYLNRTCEIGRVLRDCSSNCLERGKLFVGFANPSSEAIRDISSKNRKWDMEALCRLLWLRKFLLEELHFDYVIFDTSPGLQYSSINAIFCADFVFVVTTLDKSDLQGTQRMIQDLYEMLDKKAQVILNKVPFDFLPVENQKRKFESLGLPIVGAIPCSCDIPGSEADYFLASEKPNHLFTRTLQKIAARIE